MTTPARPAFFLSDFGDAAGTFTKIAGWLNRGLSHPAHPFRLMTVATVGPDGPAARTVVFRAFDPAGRVAWFHTDRRSPKYAELVNDPRVCLVWYDPDVRLQVRMPANVSLHAGDDASRTAWHSLADTSRRDYAAITGPGGDLADDDGEDPSAAGANFVAVACRFDSLDVLELLPAGHRRALLTWHSEWRLRRLAP